jgi:hypothetical protein
VALEQLAYEEAKRAIDRQSDAFDGLRGRAGILLAAISLATSFFGGLALRGDLSTGAAIGAWVASGTRFDRHDAFSEAAAAYVEERVSRWCTALWSLAEVLQNPVQKWKLTEPPTIVAKYDAPLRKHGTVGGEDIATPPMLSAELRAAIDAKILDGRPLTTNRFSDIPLLVGLHDAASGS